MTERDFHFQISRYDEPQEVISFSAAETELFAPIVRSAIARAGKDPDEIVGLGVVATYLNSDGVTLDFIVDEDTSVGDVFRLFGQDVAADPPALGLHGAGYGGGGYEWMQVWHVSEALAQHALLGVGAARLMFDSFKAFRAARFKRSRTLVQQWAMQGEVPDDLRERVRTSGWYTNEAKAEFGLDDFKLGELFRACDMKYMPFEHFDGGMWVTGLPEDTTE